ncbi:DUF3048 domain-containing protein [Actinacidiphila acidipaludis]|uniref:DUF3048 domain-containing protein n=1 Tax=Actinacidiphila acidipaludis TaxID=2873382 RepID=A0ABS7Q9R2_9ACTN|nr:DUF3048 domain-containing protein [Streptomyces acidipaludis]MBY8879180.1 DUF3048 domain-containing protein [Streptomyces acidipaludis]
MDKKAKVGAVAGVAAVLVGAGVGVATMVGGGGGPAPSPSVASGAVDPLSGLPGKGSLLVVKIDNVGPARPAVGLAQADIVYIERVEGGLSRIIAVYGGAQKPSVIGPVRSARETDLQVLSAFGKPAFAYSGAVSKFVPVLKRADVINVAPAEKARAYFRSTDRAAPHNLFVRTPGLTDGASVAKDIGLHFGALPAGGAAAASANAGLPAATFRFTWNDAAASYAVLMDGHDTAPARPENVIIQHVKVTDSPRGFVDTNGGGKVSEPFSQTVGSGTATVLRDGKEFTVNWSRPNPAAGTTFTYHGKPFPLHRGQTWIVLD